MKTYPLRTYVQRILIIRLGIAATLIAVCAGFITYLTLEKQLERQVVDFGRKGISALADRVRDTLIDHPIHPFEALRSLLAAGDTPMEYHAGRFVEVQFYDKTSAVIAEKSSPDYQGLDKAKRFMAAQPFSFPDAGSLKTETTRIGGTPFVFLIIPVTDRQGAVVAYGRGIFAVSPEMTAEMHQTIIRNYAYRCRYCFSCHRASLSCYPPSYASDCRLFYKPARRES